LTKALNVAPFAELEPVSGRQVAVGRRIVDMRPSIEIEDVDAVWLLCGVCQS